MSRKGKEKEKVVVDNNTGSSGYDDIERALNELEPGRSSAQRSSNYGKTFYGGDLTAKGRRTKAGYVESYLEEQAQRKDAYEKMGYLQNKEESEIPTSYPSAPTNVLDYVAKQEYAKQQAHIRKHKGKSVYDRGNKKSTFAIDPITGRRLGNQRKHAKNSQNTDFADDERERKQWDKQKKQYNMKEVHSGLYEDGKRYYEDAYQDKDYMDNNMNMINIHLNKKAQNIYQEGLKSYRFGVAADEEIDYDSAFAMTGASATREEKVEYFYGESSYQVPMKRQPGESGGEFVPSAYNDGDVDPAMCTLEQAMEILRERGSDLIDWNTYRIPPIQAIEEDFNVDYDSSTFDKSVADLGAANALDDDGSESLENEEEKQTAKMRALMMQRKTVSTAADHKEKAIIAAAEEKEGILRNPHLSWIVVECSKRVARDRAIWAYKNRKDPSRYGNHPQQHQNSRVLGDGFEEDPAMVQQSHFSAEYKAEFNTDMMLLNFSIWETMTSATESYIKCLKASPLMKPILMYLRGVCIATLYKSNKFYDTVHNWRHHLIEKGMYVSPGKVRRIPPFQEYEDSGGKATGGFAAAELFPKNLPRIAFTIELRDTGSLALLQPKEYKDAEERIKMSKTIAEQQQEIADHGGARNFSETRVMMEQNKRATSVSRPVDMYGNPVRDRDSRVKRDVNKERNEANVELLLGNMYDSRAAEAESYNRAKSKVLEKELLQQQKELLRSKKADYESMKPSEFQALTEDCVTLILYLQEKPSKRLEAQQLNEDYDENDDSFYEHSDFRDTSEKVYSPIYFNAYFDSQQAAL